MDTLDYDFFLKTLKENGPWLDETFFYFSDESTEQEHWLGCMLSQKKPYWVGGCDIPDGCEFDTAEELMNAPIYNGKSLCDRWAEVRIISTMGISLDEWCELYRQNHLMKCPRGEPEPFQSE